MRVLHQRISSVIMDILASAAVTEICTLVEDCCGALRAEVSQSKEQIKILEKQLSLAESSYRSVSCKGQTPVSSGSRINNSISGNSPAANEDDADDTHDDEGWLPICNGLLSAFELTLIIVNQVIVKLISLSRSAVLVLLIESNINGSGVKYLIDFYSFLRKSSANVTFCEFLKH